MIDAGTFSTKLTFRLPTSKDRNWYINTTPLVAVPYSGISSAIPWTVLVMGATIEKPVWSLKDCLDITSAGRRLIISLPALRMASKLSLQACTRKTETYYPQT